MYERVVCFSESGSIVDIHLWRGDIAWVRRVPRGEYGREVVEQAERVFVYFLEDARPEDV